MVAGQLKAREVVLAAQRWVGTRFRHQGRERAVGGSRGGCDCLGLLVGVAKELDLLSESGKRLADFDVRDYGHIPDGEKLQTMLGQLLCEVSPRQIKAGDVLLMRFEREPQHLAIVSDMAEGGLGIIHAYAAVRKVVEHRLDAPWRSRIVRVYRLAECA